MIYLFTSIDELSMVISSRDTFKIACQSSNVQLRNGSFLNLFEER